MHVQSREHMVGIKRVVGVANKTTAYVQYILCTACSVCGVSNVIMVKKADCVLMQASF